MTGWQTEKSRKETWKTYYNNQQKQIDGLNNIMGAVTVIVVLMTAALIVMVIGLFLDAFRDKTNSYSALQAQAQISQRYYESSEENRGREIQALNQKIADLSWLISQQTKALQGK